jgi:hypothetical protein
VATGGRSAGWRVLRWRLAAALAWRSGAPTPPPGSKRAWAPLATSPS